MSDPTMIYVTQWLGSDDRWHESIGASSDGSNQQQHYANAAGVIDYLSLRGASEFALILLSSQYGPERTRIVKRTEEVVSTFRTTTTLLVIAVSTEPAVDPLCEECGHFHPADSLGHPDIFKACGDYRCCIN
jgi:hypothetical protein